MKTAAAWIAGAATGGFVAWLTTGTADALIVVAAADQGILDDFADLLRAGLGRRIGDDNVNAMARHIADRLMPVTAVETTSGDGAGAAAAFGLADGPVDMDDPLARAVALEQAAIRKAAGL